MPHSARIKNLLMAKYTKKQLKEKEIVATAVEAGLEKFRLYAQPRNIHMKERTYGVREVIHSGKKSLREAVDAVSATGEKGWIVNLNGRQRKFVTTASGYMVL